MHFILHSLPNSITIFRGENGFIVELNPKQGGVNRALTDFVEADTTIEIKSTPGGTVILTLTNSDFTLNGATDNLDWTVTDAHTDLLPLSSYTIFVHYRNIANSLEEIGKSFLNIEDE